jgi:hypothetical protein
MFMYFGIIAKSANLDGALMVGLNGPTIGVQ